MTRFPHDEFAKGFLESLLSPFGQVQTSFKISSEVREVDVYFQPNTSIQPIPELGLLGNIAKTDFVLEPFRNPPTIFQIRACMGKLFDLHANLIREAKRTKQAEPNALSWLGNLKVILEAREIREPEDEDLMMQLSPLFLEKLQAAELVGEVKGKNQGRVEGRVEEARALVIRQLTRKLGDISPMLLAKIEALSLEQVELLGEDLLDFTSIDNLEQWLA